MPPRIRVAVVEDSALLRGMLTEHINRQPDMICVGAAREALAARELLRSSPDVVTLDAELARMDGVEFLSRLMRLRPTPVVMVSSPTGPGTELTLKALEMGALDVVAKPRQDGTDGMQRFTEDIVDAIRCASRAHIRRAPPRAPNMPQSPSASPALGQAALGKLIVIGASTGGTEATREVLSYLSADAPPVLIAQHLPDGFTRSFAARLNAASHLRVSQAEDRDPLQPGHAYVAPGGRPMWIEQAGETRVVRVGEDDTGCRQQPSVDVLFAAAARVVGADAIGVMLTGSGTDGAKAMQLLRGAGAWTIAQNEASCVAFGMPHEAIACGAVHEILPLQQIAPRLLALLRAAAPRTAALA